MGVLSDLIDGTVEVTTSTAELTAAKIYSIALGVIILLILLFLLILFAVEPISATIVAVLLIAAAVYIATRGDTEII